MSYVRTITTLVRINTGPPTWRTPHAKVERMTGSSNGFILSVGWLQVALQIGVGTRRHEEDR